jgi:5-formyltetrahydrofolate cyclo-ligase
MRRGTGVTEPNAKQAIRERVWDRLQRDGASSDLHGRIPDFVGVAATVQRLAVLPAWHRAYVIKANPDQAQLPVRAAAQACRRGTECPGPRQDRRHPGAGGDGEGAVGFLVESIFSLRRNSR